MRRGRLIALCVVLLFTVLLMGCAQTEEREQIKKKKEVSEIVLEDSKAERFTFRDVKGAEYEAELLADVPKSPYVSEGFREENGYRLYADASGRIITKLGIDVSEYQPQIDWRQVKEAGIEFAIIRLGYRGYGTEGKLVEDPLFRSHIEGAVSAGLEVGVYFFSQAVSAEETQEEASFVLERIRDYKVTYPVVFDTEEITYDTSRTEGMSRQQFTQNCIIFCDIVEKEGYASMIYANMKWMAFTLELEKLTNYEKWYADYEAVPQCPYKFQMWQYTESGRVPGIEGNVDLNLMFTEG